VASLFNLKDMRQKEASLIGCNSWCKREWDLLDPKTVLIMKGHVM